MTYDNAGNITSDQRFRNLIYGYDANGRQNFSAAANGSGPVTAIFDGAGQRVANKAGGVLSIMVYDAGGKLVAEYGATAPSTANLQYVTADYQGSTRVVTNSSGAIVNRRDYLPFGEEIGATVGSRTTDKGLLSGSHRRGFASLWLLTRQFSKLADAGERGRIRNRDRLVLRRSLLSPVTQARGVVSSGTSGLQSLAKGYHSAACVRRLNRETLPSRKRGSSRRTTAKGPTARRTA